MIKIHARLIKNQKTLKSITYQNINEYESKNFYFYLTEICRRLEISTPIVIAHSRENYEDFNFVKFSKDDFVDSINFDYLLLENIDR